MPIYRYQFSGVSDSLESLGRFLPTVPLSAATGPATIVDIEVAAASKSDLDGVMAQKGYAFVIQDPTDSAAEASALLTLSQVTLYNGGLVLSKRAGVNFAGSAQAVDDPLNHRVNFNGAAVGNVAPVRPQTSPVVGVSPFASRDDHAHPAEVIQTGMIDQVANVTTTSTSFVNLLSGSVVVQGGTALLLQVSGAISNSQANRDMNMRLVIDGVAFHGAGTRSPAANIAAPFAFAFRLGGLAAGSRTIFVQWKTSAGTAQCRPVTAIESEHCTLTFQEVRL